MNAEYIDRDLEWLKKRIGYFTDHLPFTALVVKHLWLDRHKLAEYQYAKETFTEAVKTDAENLHGMVYAIGPVIFDVMLFVVAMICYPFSPRWLREAIADHGAKLIPGVVEFHMLFSKKWQRMFGQEPQKPLEEPYTCSGCNCKNYFVSLDPGVCHHCRMDRLMTALEKKQAEMRAKKIVAN